jgi:porphobilinogen synthase
MVVHFPSAGYPTTRLRRNRRDGWTRRLVAENKLSVDDLIWPIFVRAGKDLMEPVTTMPGQFRHSPDRIVASVQAAYERGIPAVAIFPLVEPGLKTEDGAEAVNPNNALCDAVRRIKDAVPDIGVICDAALDPFTSHGHDGVIEDGYVQNDITVELLCQQSIVQARAGCDVIAPSDMMDGRIGAIRKALDGEGFDHVRILSYAAKYASAYFAPFRDAVGSAANLGTADKKTYQMDYANSDEALREVALDLAEGADMVMVKPGLPYLDIIRRVKDTFGAPTVAYNVSGEYSMLKAAAIQGWLEYDRAMMEALMSFKRAGADAILTYAAMEAAELLDS